MNKIFLFLFYCLSTVNAFLVDSNFSQKDLQVLEDLDIEISFIRDYKLKKIYDNFLNKNNSNTYVDRLNNASLFLPRVKKVLKHKGLPPVFLYMAMAESNFTIDAKSKAKAIGLWQFMKPTAKNYGLKKNLYIDERMDIVKSTLAASRYLKTLHKIFGKWYLAALAYNCGEGRVTEAIVRASLDKYVLLNPQEINNPKIKDFRKTIKNYQERKNKFLSIRKILKKIKKWDIELSLTELLKIQGGLSRNYLPKESRIYIRKIIALAIMNSNNFIKTNQNSHLLNMGISSTIATVSIKGGLHLKNISKVINMKYADLKSLNKHLIRSIIPPNEKLYSIHIPYNKLFSFNKNKDSIEDTKYIIYIVKNGDTLSKIANIYNIPYKLIKNYNNLKSNILRIRQKLIIPILNNILVKNIKSGDKIAIS